MQLLITTNAQIQKSYPLPKAFTFEAVEASLKTAQRLYLKKLLGKEFLEEVAEYYEEPAEGLQAELVGLINDALVNLGMFHFAPKGNVIIDETGIKVTKSQEMTSAWPWQVRELKESLYTDGFAAIESMLELLEENPTEFATWHTHVFAHYKKSFLRNAQQFSIYYNIHDNRGLFLELQGIMSRHETTTLKSLMGAELFALVKADPDAEEYADIVELSRYLLAHATVADGIFQKAVTFSRLGINTYTSSASSDSFEVPVKASDQAITALHRQCASISGDYQIKLTTLLEKKAAAGELDVYKNSTAYQGNFQTVYGVLNNGYLGI